MFALNLPINPVSFGQVSTIIMRELLKRNENPHWFPIGNSELGAQTGIEGKFVEWLQRCGESALASHSRNNPIFKLWHLNGSLESFSNKQVLLTFYELDAPTPIEVNIAKNQAKLLVTNKYTAEIFKDAGVSNVAVIPLAFDHYNFHRKDKQYFFDNRIVFNLLGKLEKRKRHEKVIRAWIKKFGNNHKYFLQCAVFNPFLKPEDNMALFSRILEGKTYFNVNYIGHMTQNELYNDFLNSANIVIAMSGGEGWGLGEFHSLAIGKYCVGLYAHGHKEWMTSENSILVNPCGKIEAADGMFFSKGGPFNQGNIYDWNEDEFIAACETAIRKVEINPINKAGLDLQTQFKSEKFVDSIINEMSTI